MKLPHSPLKPKKDYILSSSYNILLEKRGVEMRIISWNVNGIRAVVKKGFWDWFNQELPDILCFQETKAQPDQLDDALINPPGYYASYHSAKKKGYSGVAMWSKVKPLSVESDILEPEFDDEGRTICAEFEDFYLYGVYFPNGQSRDDRLHYKLRFYESLLKHMKKKMQYKPIIVVGDYNTAHTSIDLARPKANETVSGFLPEERVWVDAYLDAGLVDTFRKEHPDMAGYYSWWSYRANARVNNVGWRIDYFLVDQRLESVVESSNIYPDITGSDHCPIGLTLRK